MSQNESGEELDDIFNDDIETIDESGSEPDPLQTATELNASETGETDKANIFSSTPKVFAKVNYKYI